MATEAQIEANRVNAQKSTGPRTPEGKATVAQNAVKHGLLARTGVLHGEEWEEYTCFSEGLLDELSAQGVQEEELAGRILSLSWRLRRATRNQNTIFEALYDKYVAAHGEEPLPEPDPAEGRPADGAPLLGRMLVADFAGEKVLERMLMYERRIESSLYRTMAELRKLQTQRKAEGHGLRPRAEPLIPDDHPIWGRSLSRAPQPAWKPGREANSPEAERLQEILDEAALLAAEADDIAAMDLPQGPEQLCQTNPIGGSLRGAGVPLVNENHGRDAHATALPVGVGANASQVQEQTRQTKPIGAGADQSQVGYTPIFRRRS